MRIAPLAGTVAATLFLSSSRLVFAQPLLREGGSDAEVQEDVNSEESPQREAARRQAQFEEERRLRLQQELMQLRGEQMQAEQEEIKRRDTVMRYALIIAIAVIATTFLIAYARSRAAQKDDEYGL